MEGFARKLLRHRRAVLMIFVLALALSASLIPLVRVNYDMTAYVPDEAPSTLGMQRLFSQFHEAIPNVELMVDEEDRASMDALKRRLLAMEEVTAVHWLDAYHPSSIPFELIDQESLKGFIHEGKALYRLHVDSTDIGQSLEQIRLIAGPSAMLRGSLVENNRANTSATEELNRIMLFAVPAALIILLLATSSWFEPLLFMLSIFAGVLLNLGTNAFLGEISFITQAVGAVLQLAVSMDYGIFLLHRFKEYRAEGHAVEAALSKAVARSFSAITASALTTFFGFLALVFMRFKIGPDLGVVLAKGIFFSLLSVLFFLPALLRYSYKLIEKTAHPVFLASFRGLGKVTAWLAPVFVLVVLLLTVPVFKAQQANHFLYGMGAYPEEAIEGKERRAMEAIFPEGMQMVLMYPKGDKAKEAALAKELKALPYVTALLSFTEGAGSQVPAEMLDAEALAQLEGADDGRIIVMAQLAEEGPQSFAATEELRALAAKYYGEAAQWTGRNFVIKDMRDTVHQDNLVVNGLAILAVALVLALTFRSLSLPIIMVFTIEFSIWCNLAIPYLTGEPLNFIGYLVISTIQLGATVDYAILSTQNYLDRRHRGPKQAAIEAVTDAAPAIIPPALILALVGFILARISSIDVVSEIGLVLGRGALLSLLNVLFLLPGLLRLFDKLIRPRQRPTKA